MLTAIKSLDVEMKVVLQVLNPEGGGPLARVVVITDEDGQYFLPLLIHRSVLVLA